MRKKYAFLAMSIFVMLSIIILTGCSILGGGSSNDTKIKNLRDFTAEVVEKDIVYDGTEKQVAVALYDGKTLVATVSENDPHPDFEIRYSNNVNVGEARAYVSAKDGSTKYIGSVSVSFVISPVASVTVNDAELLREYVSSGGYAEVKLGQDLTVTENVFLNIHAKTTLNLNGKKLNMEGGLSLSGCLKFESDSVLYLHREINIKGSGSIVVDGTDMAIYTDKAIELPTTYEGLSVYQRTKLDISLEKYLYDYVGEEITPAVISDCDASEYDIRYENNVNVGTATVIVTAKPDSKYVFGICQKYFTIATVPKIAYDDATLAEIMQDKNFTIITLKGEFSDIVIPEGYNVIADEDVAISGNLTVNGKLSINSVKNFSVGGQTVINGTFINNGIVISEGLHNNGEITNHKTLTLNGKFQNDGKFLNTAYGGNVYCNGDYASGENSTFTNNGLVYFECAFENEGEMKNNGDVYFFAKENITSNNRITNEGCIYSDISLANILYNSYKGKSVVRREITEEDVSFYTTEWYYDGTAKSPMPKFASGSGSLTVDSNDYYLARRYADSEASSYATINPGVVNVTIKFKKESKSYTGTIVLQYEILRGVCTITQNSDFDTVFNDANYATALIDGNFSTSKDLIIPDYSELRISENGGLVYTGTMQVFGVVNNYGNLAFAKTGFSQISIEEGGCINNAGNVFFNETAQEGVISGEGEIFVRTEIQRSYITDLPDKVPYDTVSNYGVRPDFTVVMNGTELVKSEDYIAEYSNNKTLNSGATVKVSARDFSKNIYGYVVRSFAIERGTVTVNSYDDMIKALATSTNGVCNFTTVYLGNNAFKSIGGITNTPIETITVPKDTVLDCGQYVLDLRIREGYKGTYKIENYGTIKVKKPFPNMDYKYNTALGGEVIGETDNFSDLAGLSVMCSKIYITGNVPYQSGDHTIKPTKCDLEIDLQGYTVADLKIHCQYKSLTIKSTDRRGAVSVQISYTDKQITFENLRMINNNYNGYSGYVTCKNCTFT